VLAFLAWHVVWAVTGLRFPAPSGHHGAARMLMWGFDAVIYVMVAVGIAGAADDVARAIGFSRGLTG
jgi:hypothetical protein